MLENKTEQQAREEILLLVKEYTDKFHNTEKEFQQGQRIFEKTVRCFHTKGARVIMTLDQGKKTWEASRILHRKQSLSINRRLSSRYK